MRQCAKCGKGSIMVGTRVLLRGHYNPTNWTRKYPNLQKHRTESGKRILVCTQCLKGMNKPAKNKKVAKAKTEEVQKSSA